MSFWTPGKRKKALLLGGIALLLAVVVAVCFCCVRIETPQQRQQRLASQAGTVSAWSAVSGKTQVEPASSLSSDLESSVSSDESGASHSANSETESVSPPEENLSSGSQAQSGHWVSQTAGGASSESPSSGVSKPAASSQTGVPETPPSETPQTNTVTLSISCQTALPYEEQLGLSLPENGMLLETTQWEFTGSATVWDAFQAVCAAHGIDYKATSSWSGQYIREISGLRELACGSTSGWVYYLNGGFSSLGVSSQPLQDGDTVQFAYTVTPGDSIPQ